MPIAAVAISYLIGAVSFPYWVGRARGVDLRDVGSRKLGGSNLWKSVGPVWGVLGGGLDAVKGMAVVLAAAELGLSFETQLACGIAAIVGQMWPVFHGFDGGRANATGWGVALTIDPIAGFIMLLPVVYAIFMSRLVSPHPTRVVPLASLLSFAVFPAVTWETEGVVPTVVGGLLIFGLILMRRITAGIAADLATGAPAHRVIINRALYDRSELQERGLVAL